LEITTGMIKELREQSGAGIMDCRSALIDCDGDVDKALDFLKEKGLATAQKKAERSTSQGLIEAYIHTAVARTDEYKELAHCLAMQVAALAPKYISEEEIKEDEETDPKEACLLAQPYIKDPTRTVKDIIVETVAKVGENIRVGRFIRYELGE
jgi:elongation factor Ts